MKILKEEKLEEYECPKCKRALDFSHNERKKEGSYSKFKVFLGTEDKYTKNGWFDVKDVIKFI